MKNAVGGALLALLFLAPLSASFDSARVACLAQDKPEVAVRPVANIGGLEESGASITGIVKFTGKQPERKPLASITGNAYCSEHCNGQPPLDEKWVFGKNGSDDTFANVLVYVAKGLEGKKFTPPKTPTILDQVGCVYTPRVVGVMVGQTLQVRNSDSTLHNVMANLRTNKSFNEGMSVKGSTIEKVFQNPEFKADFRCFMHPWMVAYVHVMDHPYYAITGPDGSFTLRGLPPGEYEVAALHESTRFECSGRVTVKVATGESKKIEFVYKDAQ